MVSPLVLTALKAFVSGYDVESPFSNATKELVTEVVRTTLEEIQRTFQSPQTPSTQHVSSLVSILEAFKGSVLRDAVRAKVSCGHCYK